MSNKKSYRFFFFFSSLKIAKFLLGKKRSENLRRDLFKIIGKPYGRMKKKDFKSLRLQQPRGGWSAVYVGKGLFSSFALVGRYDEEVSSHLATNRLEDSEKEDSN